MRTNKFLACFLVICLGICSAGFAAEAKAEAKIPSSLEMALDTDKTVKEFDPDTNPESGLVPNDFRGADPNSGDKHWLEDAGVLMSENSDLYNTDAAGIATDAKFVTKPEITWTTKKCSADGNFEPKKEDTTNKAVNPCNIHCPGIYEVHNGGARRVEAPTEDPDSHEVATESKVVTAQARQGIEVHDCTPPDLWVAFEECAGQVDVDKSCAKLEQEILKEIITANKDGLKGRPNLGADGIKSETRSYLCIDEGEKSERDELPGKKKARVTVIGSLFSNKGVAVDGETGQIANELERQNLTNKVEVNGGEDNPVLKGLFVRRNVPFICCAASADNFNERKTSSSVEYYIEKGDGQRIEKQDSYLFRVPNYPRDEYADQPEYFFVTKAVDKAGNSTNIRMPLYVMETQTAFEGGKNQ